MKLYYFTRYRSFHPAVHSSLKFFLISDIHYSHNIKGHVLQAVINSAKKRQPDYICIAGDLVDCQDEIDAKPSRLRFLAWLEQLGAIAPVIVIPGNHDFYRRSKNFTTTVSLKHNEWLADPHPTIFKEIAQIPNLHFLNNEAYEDAKVHIFGFVPQPEYYQLERTEAHSTSILNPGHEDKAILLRDIRHLPAECLNGLPKRKVKLLLFHSPCHLHDPEVIEYFREFDYFISGHMHNGCVPPILNEIWRSNHGLVGPGKVIAPKHVRLRRKVDGDKSLVLGPITTIQACAKPISALNRCFPINVAELALDNNPIHKKADISFKYVSYK